MKIGLSEPPCSRQHLSKTDVASLANADFHEQRTTAWMQEVEGRRMPMPGEPMEGASLGVPFSLVCYALWVRFFWESKRNELAVEPLPT